MKNLTLTLCALVATLSVAPLFGAIARPSGTVTTSTGSHKGELRWRASDKEYSITSTKGEVRVKEEDVVKLDVTPPATYADAVKKVRGGRGSSAVAALQEIATTYRHLTYDQEATGWLVEAYLQQNKADDAVRACQTVIRDDPEAAYKGPMAAAYFKALIAANRSSDLNRLIDRAVASGDSDAAAAALVARGDAAVAKGDAATNYEAALSDGYLRVVLLYAGTPSYKDALQKAATAFRKLNQTAYAQQLEELLQKTR